MDHGRIRGPHRSILDAETIDLVRRNYAEVFPHVSVWYTHVADLVLLGFNDAERALDVTALEERFAWPDFAAGLKRAGIESIPELLAKELLPLDTLNASKREGPLHTLRHPRLSDMAARAFFVGSDAVLPKLATPEAAEIGFRNSMLRRYAGGQSAPSPDDVSEAAVRVTCYLNLLPECATLLAHWRRVVPESERRDQLLMDLRSKSQDPQALSEKKLKTLEILFGGRPLMKLDGRQSLARAQRISRLFLRHYHPAVPFDRDVLRAAWRECTDVNCDAARRRFEAELGKIDVPDRGDRTRRGSGAGNRKLDTNTEAEPQTPSQ